VTPLEELADECCGEKSQRVEITASIALPIVLHP
jgi:hypothetical protein